MDTLIILICLPSSTYADIVFTFYTLLWFINLIKLYIESKNYHITTAEYSHKNFTTKIVPIASLK